MIPLLGPAWNLHDDGLVIHWPESEPFWLHFEVMAVPVRAGGCKVDCVASD